MITAFAPLQHGINELFRFESVGDVSAVPLAAPAIVDGALDEAEGSIHLAGRLERSPSLNGDGQLPLTRALLPVNGKIVWKIGV